jgi:hypothetical protein
MTKLHVGHPDCGATCVKDLVEPLTFLYLVSTVPLGKADAQ